MTRADAGGGICPGSSLEQILEHAALDSPQGEATGHIEEVGGRYRGVASAGRDPVTGRQPKTELFATAEEAEAELLELHRQIDEERQPKRKILVSALIEKWFEVVELEDSTRERYEGLTRSTQSRRSAQPSSPTSTPSIWKPSTRGSASAGTSATNDAQKVILHTTGTKQCSTNPRSADGRRPALRALDVLSGESRGTRQAPCRQKGRTRSPKRG